jgi:hypothetical protein
MQSEGRTFEFLVEHTERGWMVLNGPLPLGPFFTKEQALDLASGMATAMRAMGDVVTVRVKD